MAEEKTFRNGFIILGLFLLAVGMFIMTADRPQVYITFCVMGGIMLVSGVTWSMCQCYPKIAFVPADTDFESFLSPKGRGPGESDGSENKGSQPPYSRLEEEEVSMQSPPDYHHIQMKVFGSGEDQGVLSAPQAEPQAGREGRGPYSEAFMETAAVVHVVEAESHQGRLVASQVPAAPLASFRDELDSSGGGSSRDPSPPEEEEPWARRADAQPDRYPDFALIDAAGADEEAGLSPGPSQGTPPRFWPRPPAGPAAPKDEASEGGIPDSGEATELAPEEPEEEEEDLYYGLKDGPGGALEEEELFNFEPDS